MRRATTASVTSAYTVNADSAARQPSHSLSSPPSGAQMQATMPRPVSALDMARAPSSGVYRSRTMARAHITTAPMAAPWAMRHTMSSAMLGASALPTEATV